MANPMSAQIFDPNEFFQTGEGLWISEEFIMRILSLAHRTPIIIPKSPSFIDLKRTMANKEIRGLLPGNHVFTNMSKYCESLARMIKCQPNGEYGHLVVDGHPNLSYVQGVRREVFLMRTYWLENKGRWFLSPFRPGGEVWSKGARVFYNNNATTNL